MNSIDKHSVWELNVKGFQGPILADELLNYLGHGNTDLATPIIKSLIAREKMRGNRFATCSFCEDELILVASNGKQKSYFRHTRSEYADNEKIHCCPFYLGGDDFFDSSLAHQQEASWHLETKHFIHNHLLLSPNVKKESISIQSYLFDKSPDNNRRRKPDLYFEDIAGNRFAIELTRWWMNPQMVADREQFFKDLGVNLIWLFSPDCQANNNATLQLVMYGSATSPVASDATALEKVECNAFVLTSRNKHDTIASGILNMKALYPSPKFDLSTNQIQIEIISNLINIYDLKLDPTNRLPFAISTSDAFRLALKERHLQDRVEQANDFRAIRKLFKSEFKFDTDQEYKNTKLQLEGIELDSDYRFNAYLSSCRSTALDRLEIAYHAHCRFKLRSSKAQKIWQTRKFARWYINSLRTNSKDEPGTYVHYLELLDTKHKESDFFSTNLDKILGKILAEAKSILQKALVNDSERREADLSKINDFTLSLKKSLKTWPEGVEALKSELKEMNILAKQHRAPELARYLSSQFEILEKEAEQNYKKENFPQMSEGWCPNCVYKEELDCCLALMNSGLFGKNKQPKALAKQILNSFIVTISKWIASQNEHLSKLQEDALIQHLKEHNKIYRKCLLLVDYLVNQKIKFPYHYHQRLSLIVRSIYMIKDNESDKAAALLRDRKT